MGFCWWHEGCGSAEVSRSWSSCSARVVNPKPNKPSRRNSVAIRSSDSLMHKQIICCNVRKGPLRARDVWPSTTSLWGILSGKLLDSLPMRGVHRSCSGINTSGSEFNEFKPHLKSSKTRLKILQIRPRNILILVKTRFTTFPLNPSSG